MRNLKYPIKMLGLAALLVVFSTSMFAGLSPVIYNTGVNSGGLIGYPGTDAIFMEYTYGLTAPILNANGTAPSGFTSSGASVIEDPALYPLGPNPPWIANTATAQWITTPDGDAATGDPGGELGAGGFYVYTEAFSMTGFNPVGATLAGNFAADNGATAYLNGVLIGTTPYPLGFNSLTALGNGAGDFHSGVNYLSFIVQNEPDGGSNPTGLFVDSLAITAMVLPTPEPAFYGVLAIGLAGLFVAVRSRKAVKA